MPSQQPWDTRLVEALSSLLAKHGLERPGDAAMELLRRTGGKIGDLDRAIGELTSGIGTNPNAPQPPMPSPLAGPVPAPELGHAMPASIPPPFGQEALGPPAGMPPPPTMPSPQAMAGPAPAGPLAPPGPLVPPPGMPPMPPPQGAPAPPTPLPPQMTDSQMQGGGPVMPQLPPQMTDSQMQPPPQPPPSFGRVSVTAEPVMAQPPPFSPMAGPVEGGLDLARGLAGNSMLGAFPPAGPQPQATPQMAQRSPFDDSRSIESYFSDSSLAQRLQDAQRYARNDALLAAGAAMLGGEGLLSGMSAAGEAVRGPRAELQRKREELPLEYAQARFGIEGERERRGYAQAGEGREVSEEARRAAREGRESRAFEPQQAVAEALARRAAPGGINEQLDDLEITAKGLGNQAVEQQVAKIKADIQREAELLPFEKDLLQNRAYAEGQQGKLYSRSPGYGTSASAGPKGKLTQTQKANLIAKARKAATESDLTVENLEGQYLAELAMGVGAFDDADVADMDEDLIDARDVMEILGQGVKGPDDLLADPEIAGNPRLVQLIQFWKETHTPAAVQ